MGRNSTSDADARASPRDRLSRIQGKARPRSGIRASSGSGAARPRTGRQAQRDQAIGRRSEAPQLLELVVLRDEEVEVPLERLGRDARGRPAIVNVLAHVEGDAAQATIVALRERAPGRRLLPGCRPSGISSQRLTAAPSPVRSPDQILEAPRLCDETGHAALGEIPARSTPLVPTKGSPGRRLRSRGTRCAT